MLLHLGTLAAVILAFWKDVREVVTEFLRMLHLRRTPRGLKPNRRERRLISFLILATLPLIPAAFLSNVVESLYQNTFFIGFAFVMTGFLLFAADRMGHGNKDERSSTSADAIVVGLAQAVAVVPGLSRSGTTISAGMLRGFERSFAVNTTLPFSVARNSVACSSSSFVVFPHKNWTLKLSHGSPSVRLMFHCSSAGSSVCLPVQLVTIPIIAPVPSFRQRRCSALRSAD